MNETIKNAFSESLPEQGKEIKVSLSKEEIEIILEAPGVIKRDLDETVQDYRDKGSQGDEEGMMEALSDRNKLLTIVRKLEFSDEASA